MTANTIKEQHLKDVRQALKELRSATKPQLAAHTGLSVVTINSLVRTLVENGELQEEKEPATNGGRPAAVYSLNRNRKMAIIFGTREKNGEDFITASVINIYGELAEPFQQFTELSVQNLVSSLAYYTKKYPTIKVAAFALPAKEYDGRIIFCDYKQLEGFPLRSYIEEKYHIPCIIENDIRIAILGRFTGNHSTGMSNIAGIYFPQKYSVGVGLFLNGNILSGSKGLAAEIEFHPSFLNIDWKNRTLEQSIDLIRAVCIMYNPDTLILYDAFLTEEMFQKIQDAFSDDIYRHFRPEFIRVPQIEEDYIRGLKQFALHYIETENL